MSENIPTPQENEAIRRDITETRHRMDNTLDRLLDRFRPRHLLNDLLAIWQSRGEGDGDRELAGALEAKARTAGRALTHQIRDNPMPSLLLGAGLAWLILDRIRPEHETRYYEPADVDDDVDETYGDFPGSYPEPHMEVSEYRSGTSGPSSGGPTGKAHAAGEKAGRIAGEARRRVRQGGRHLRERARDLRERASESSHHMGQRLGERGHRIRERAAEMSQDVRERVREGYEHTQDRMMKTCQRAQRNLRIAAEHHPLAAGAACMGLGLLVGVLLPRSAQEDEWFGETASKVKERAKDEGQDLVARGKHVAETAVQAARSEAERQGLTPAQLKESAKSVGNEARQAAQQSAEEEGLGPGSIHKTAQASTGNKQSSESGPQPQSPAF
jgi:ElaB/YqjD/DUF883 family membrane-anchored ribosome-binding protein